MSPLPAACLPCLWDRDRGWAREAMRVGKCFKRFSRFLPELRCSRAGLKRSSPPTGKGQDELGGDKLPKESGLGSAACKHPRNGEGSSLPLIPLPPPLPPCTPQGGHSPVAQQPPAAALLQGHPRTALPSSLPSRANWDAGSNWDASQGPGVQPITETA